MLVRLVVAVVVVGRRSPEHFGLGLEVEFAPGTHGVVNEVWVA